MWIKCVTILDEPDKVGPFELTDILIILGLFFLISFLWGLFLGLGLGGVLLLLLYWCKRGKPAGWLKHVLHALEFLRLPGFLSPRRKRYGPY